MQLIALSDDRPIVAFNADRHAIYQCPECRLPVRVRGGPHRQTHFYHLRSDPHCHQHKKTLIHLRIQLLLQARLPGSQIERPYPEIGRIADVSWQGMVFEIQYSPLSLAEAEERCEDYRKIGLIPVWILHDARFNKRRMSLSETFLRKNNLYYTNINAQGQGTIYDQFDICKNMQKLFIGPPLPIDLGSYRKIGPLIDPTLPQGIKERWLPGKLVFHGDLIDRTIKIPHSLHLSSMLQIERKYFKSASQKKLKILKNIYRFFLNGALERSAREM